MLKVGSLAFARHFEVGKANRLPGHPHSEGSNSSSFPVFPSYLAGQPFLGRAKRPSLVIQQELQH